MDSQASETKPSPERVALATLVQAYQYEGTGVGSSDLSSPPSSMVENVEKVDRIPRGQKRKRASVKIEPQEQDLRRSVRAQAAEIANGSPSEANTPVKTRKPAKRIKGSVEPLKLEPPDDWQRVWDVTVEMRKNILAPVDTMGCETLAEDHRSPIDKRLQTLIALMLSSQTKDTVTAAAMINLQQNLEGGFTLTSLLAVEPARLNELIAKVGFHNNKTKYIKATAEILQREFAGDIPDTIEGMISLPGVGPKMAYLCMSSAWGRDLGIGVDVHVHRITNLWGWHKTSNPEATRACLESWLPRDKWHAINHLLVGLGQMVCLPIGRRCDQCDLATQGLCPSAVVPSAKTIKSRVKREIVLQNDDEEYVDVKEEPEVAMTRRVRTREIKIEAADE